jgi:hypothetical protein
VTRATPQRVLRRGPGIRRAIYAFSPLDVSGLAAWYKAETIAQADASAVAAWADSGPNARNLTQATGTSQPTYRTNVLNGHPTVRFDGGDSLVSAAFAFAQPATTFVVGRMSVITGFNQYFVDGLTTNVQALFATPTTYSTYAGTAIVSDGVSNIAFRLLCAVVNGAVSRMRTDGGAGTGGNAGTGSYNGVRLGSAGAGNATFLTGDIAEVIIYAGVLSPANMNAIGAYLAGKYGVAWTTAT